MADLGGLTEVVRKNKLLGLVTISRQWNNKENENNWATHHGKGQGGKYASKWGFYGAVQMPKGPDP